MEISVVAELHDPGTLISPWTGAPYTPVYYLVETSDTPQVPDGEEIELSFMETQTVLESDLFAGPEKAALLAALALHEAWGPSRSESR